MTSQVAVLALLAGFLTAPAAADSWGGTGTFVTDFGWYPAPVHASLLPDGRVVFSGLIRPSATPPLDSTTGSLSWILQPTPAGTPTPALLEVAGLDTPVVAAQYSLPPWIVDDSLFCSGHTLLADGRLITLGGTRTFFDPVTEATLSKGLDYGTLFDGLQWTRITSRMKGVGPGGSAKRWYPTATRLPDQRILVTGGFETVYPYPKYNASVEIYDPAAESFEVVSPYAATPGQIWAADYTHVFVLPDRVANNDVLMFGQGAIPILADTAELDTTGLTWTLRPSPRPGSIGIESPSLGTSTVLLPIRLQQGEWGYTNGSVLLTGGKESTTMVDHADVYDPALDLWLPRQPTGVGRHHPSIVILPDGRLLVVNGHDPSESGDPNTRRAGYIDPADGFSHILGTASQEFVRGYHSNALLLPDGRVMVSGGRDDLTGQTAEKPTFDYLSPDYMSEPRPKILGASAIDYGGYFGIAVVGPEPTEVVLLALGSHTHSFDMNQRYIQLELTGVLSRTGFVVAVSKGPRDTRVAPPGYYMLFVLDANRIPSEARIVQLLPPS